MVDQGDGRIITEEEGTLLKMVELEEGKGWRGIQRSK